MHLLPLVHLPRSRNCSIPCSRTVASTLVCCSACPHGRRDRAERSIINLGRPRSRTLSNLGASLGRSAPSLGTNSLILLHSLANFSHTAPQSRMPARSVPVSSAVCGFALVALACFMRTRAHLAPACPYAPMFLCSYPPSLLCPYARMPVCHARLPICLRIHAPLDGCP